MSKFYLILLCSIMSVLGCNTHNDDNPKVSNPISIEIDENQLLKNLQIVSHDSMQGRLFSTEGNLKARRFIADQFKLLQIYPAFEGDYIQEFDGGFEGSDLPGGNVIGQIKGTTDKIIVITAHYDHLGVVANEVYNGADDNASGISALFALASYFKDKTPKHNLVFAALDGEEIGSIGADYLLNNFPTQTENIALNINMDMISRNDSNEIYAVGLYHYPELKQYLIGISSDIDLMFGHDDPMDNNYEDWTYLSDHSEFHVRNIPFVYFGVENHQDYHRPTDTFDKIDQDFYIKAVKLIIQATHNLDHM